jgi:hypothetical protein
MSQNQKCNESIIFSKVNRGIKRSADEINDDGVSNVNQNNDNENYNDNNEMVDDGSHDTNENRSHSFLGDNTIRNPPLVPPLSLFNLSPVLRTKTLESVGLYSPLVCHDKNLEVWSPSQEQEEKTEN